MKKFRNEKEKKALGHFLFKNYIVISALLVFMLVLSLVAADIFVDQIFFKKMNIEDISEEDIYAYPFENIKTDVIDTYGGWYEILDEDWKVIFVKGEKRDEIYQYNQQTLFNKLNLNTNKGNILYYPFSVSGPNGENYILLWKLPKKNVLNYGIKAIMLLLIIFSVLLLIILYFYSTYTVKQIRNPLKSIIHGIKEMERHNYKIRLDFNAEKEFAEIRDAFNKMALRIQDANAEKEQIEKDKKKMLLHLSHDLKTPITSIYGFAKLLYDNEIKDESDRRKYLKYIYDKSFYVANLVKDLFEFAKLEDSNVKLNKKAVNITEWLRQIVIELYAEIEEKGLKVEVDILEENIQLNIDDMKMKRVITNIINNSIKYNDKGTLIYVGCKKVDSEIKIVLGDNGLGIDNSIKNVLFKDYIRGHHNDKDGTGLGLAISKRIVNLHNGTITYKENEKLKTLFEIILPI